VCVQWFHHYFIIEIFRCGYEPALDNDPSLLRHSFRPLAAFTGVFSEQLGNDVLADVTFRSAASFLRSMSAVHIGFELVKSALVN